MTGSPEFDHSNKEAETPDTSASRVPSEDLLSGQNLSPAPLSDEYLLGADTDRIASVIERALHDIDLLNEFIDQYQFLCANSAEDMNEFCDRLCQAIATSFEKHQENRIADEYKSLLKLSSMVEYLFDSIDHKPADEMPPSLNQLLHVCVRVVYKLALDRSAFASAEDCDSAHPKGPSWSSMAWGHVYAQIIDHISRGLKIGSSGQNPELVDVIQRLLEMQFAWRREGFSPVESNHEGIIRIWQKVFLLAETLADSRFVDEILIVAEQFLKYSLSEEPDVVVSDTDSDEDIDSRLMLAEALELCECAALYALDKCQDNLRPVFLWQRILDEGEFMSGRWRLALKALAKIDVDETSPYTARLLNLLARKSIMEPDRMGLRKRMLRELMSYLEKPGTEDVLVRVFDTNEESHVKPVRQQRLISLLHKMHARPNESWSPQALKRLKYALDRLESP
jgi:hypothetical protein